MPYVSVNERVARFIRHNSKNLSDSFWCSKAEGRQTLVGFWGGWGAGEGEERSQEIIFENYFVNNIELALC